jgi:hypothetical protein
VVAAVLDDPRPRKGRRLHRGDRQTAGDRRAHGGLVEQAPALHATTSSGDTDDGEAIAAYDGWI